MARKSNYMRLSSLDAARAEHGTRRERAQSASAFRRSLKGMPASARRLAKRARKAAMVGAQRAHRAAMRDFEGELRAIKRASTGRVSTGSERVRITKAKSKPKPSKKSRGPIAALKKLGRKFFGGSGKKSFGWGAASESKRFKSGKSAGRRGKKLRLHGGKKHKKTNPSLSMIPGYDLIMSGPLGEALTYAPGAAIGVAAAVVFPRALPSWNVGWKGILLKILATGLTSGTVAHFISRKHGVAVAIGGLVATIVEGVNLWLSPGSPIRAAFDLSGLADLGDSVADDGTVLLEPGDELGSGLKYDSGDDDGLSGSLTSDPEDMADLVMAGSVDSTADLSDLSW